MNVQSNVKKLSGQSFDPRLALSAVRLRLAARLDFLVARWLQRCAVEIEAAQCLFETEAKSTREFGMT
jgi:hypothetical protein